MPYNNPLNRQIAHQLKNIDERHIHNTLNSYDVPYSVVGNANKKYLDDINIGKERAMLEDKLRGGNGFAHGTIRDTGYGSVLGAGGHRLVDGSQYNNWTGGSFWNDFKKGFSSVIKPLAGVVGMLPIPGANLLSKGLDVVGNIAGGTKRKPKAKGLLLSRKVVGGASVSDIGMLKKTTRRTVGGGGDGLSRPFNMINKDGKTGGNKLNMRQKVVPVAQMQSSSMAGQGKNKTKEKRTDIVKRIMKQRGVNMITASSIVKKENLY